MAIVRRANLIPPVIPKSQTPYVKHSHTQLTVTASSTSEVELLRWTIPANLVGPNFDAWIYAYWRDPNNSGNNKTAKMYVGAQGAALGSMTVVASRVFANRACPCEWSLEGTGVYGSSGCLGMPLNQGWNSALDTANVYATLDVRSAWDIAFTGQKATGTDTMHLEIANIVIFDPEAG